MLGPVDADPERDDAQILGEMDPVDRHGHLVQLAEISPLGSLSADSVVATKRHDTSDLDTECVLAATFSPIGSTPTW